MKGGSGSRGGAGCGAGCGAGMRRRGSGWRRRGALGIWRKTMARSETATPRLGAWVRPPPAAAAALAVPAALAQAVDLVAQIVARD